MRARSLQRRCALGGSPCRHPAPPAPSGPPPTAPTLSELLATAQQYQDEHTEAAARSLLQAAATPRPLPPAHEAYIKQLEERSAAGEDFLAVPGAQAEFNSMLAALARGLQLNRSEMRERLTPSATHTPVRQDLDEDMEPDATVRGLIAKWKREEAHAAAAAAEKKAAATAATSAAGRKEE